MGVSLHGVVRRVFGVGVGVGILFLLLHIHGNVRKRGRRLLRVLPPLKLDGANARIGGRPLFCGVQCIVQHRRRLESIHDTLFLLLVVVIVV
jgi:hypothetical protein